MRISESNGLDTFIRSMAHRPTIIASAFALLILAVLAAVTVDHMLWVAPMPEEMECVARTRRQCGPIVDYMPVAPITAPTEFGIRELKRRDGEGHRIHDNSPCVAWTHHTGGQALLMSLDFPAYQAAALAYSVGARQATCIDALLTPRGELFTAPFVAALWFLVGLTVRRLAQHRWRHAARSRIGRMVVFLGLAPLPFGVLALFMAALLFVFFHVEMAARLAGFGFWLLFLPTLSAGRLRLWPFKPI